MTLKGEFLNKKYGLRLIIITNIRCKLRNTAQNRGKRHTEKVSENNICVKVHRSQITCAHGTGMALYPTFKSLYLLCGERIDFRLLTESVSFVPFCLCQAFFFFFLLWSTELSAFYHRLLELYGPRIKYRMNFHFYQITCANISMHY